MREYKLSSSTGKKLYKMGNTCCWPSLYNLYDRWSPAKEEAFNWCYDQYLKGENSTAFGVGNANTFGFTCSWLETRDGENVMRVETRDNSYLVWLER